MTLDEFREVVCADIYGLLPQLAECRKHPGRFDAAELKRISAKTPAVLVALLGILKIAEAGTGERDVDCALAAYVVTADRRGMPRDVAAVNLVDVLTDHIYDYRFGVVCGPGEEVKAKNLYSGDIDRNGVAMWGISWKQTVRVGKNRYAEDGTIPDGVYAGFSPDIGSAHVDDYTGVT